MNHLQIKGLVIADSQTRFRIEAPEDMPILGDISDGLPRGIRQCLCPVCLNFKRGVDMRKSSKFPDHENISVEKTRELTAHQYLLCSRSVWAYVMKARDWRKRSHTNIASCMRT